jgi:small GTP-binding protein
MNDQLNLRFKIVVLGEGGVGKTTLSKSFEQNTIFQTTSQTIGVDIHVKHLKFENFPCTVQLWDLGGQEHFKNMGIFPQFCEGSHGALVCFDLTDLETFNKLDQWIKLLPNKTPFILIGTKADLDLSDNCLQKEINEWKLTKNCKNYLQTRIDDYNSIKAAFNSLILNIIKNNSQEIEGYINGIESGTQLGTPLNGNTRNLYKKNDSEIEALFVR